VCPAVLLFTRVEKEHGEACQRQFGEEGGGAGREHHREGLDPPARPAQFGEDHPISRIVVEKEHSSEIDPTSALGMQLQRIASDLSKSPQALLNELRDRKTAQDANSDLDRPNASGTPIGAGVPNSRSPPYTIIRNRTQVIRTSAAIISALQEALDYDPKLHHNQTPPELWRDSPEYIAALQRIANELKKLNDLLKKESSAQKEHSSVVHLGVHINQFLNGFSSVAGKGVGWLLIASLGGLLYQTGLVPELAENVLKHIKLPK
jgi:hypothetical protein